jgi:DNA polymerase
VSGESPREAARRWLRLYRDLGVEEIAVPISSRAKSGACASQPGRRRGAAPETTEGAAPAPVPASDELAGSLTTAEAAGEPATALELLRRDVIGECKRCRLHKGRTNIVFGVGSPVARLMFVGEGPGADEDRKGEPFVGRAGQLLDRIIAAMGLAREAVYIANVVKCRPPENRNPLPDEASTCRPFLETQIRIVRPEVVVTLGKVALEELLGQPVKSITRARGQWFDFHGTPVKATFHPAYLLRSPSAKRPVWEDMQDVLARLGLEPPG